MNTLGRVLYSLVGAITRYLPGWRAQRVRVVLRTKSNEVLLVKTWLSHQRWALPGGGVEKNETAEQAAVREVHEETGIRIERKALRYLTTIRSERLRADLVMFTAFVDQQDLPQLHWPYTWEIIDRKWYPIATLPDLVAGPTKDAIALAFNSEN